MAEHAPGFGEQLREYLEAACRANGLRVEGQRYPLDAGDLPQLTVRKTEGYVQVSEELLMDEGVIPDTRPPQPRPRWRTRLRWWATTKREHLGLWAYWAITGDRIRTDDDEI